MTNLYLASVDPNHFVPDWDWLNKPMCVLSSFAYKKQWADWRVRHPWLKPRMTMLDSGAFTAYTMGESIDIDALTAETINGEWSEAVGLDVIGSFEGSVKNADYMRSKGSMAMPVFHIGDPMWVLDYYVKHWPKVGLSCLFGEPRHDSFKFYDQCFARAWPHKFHSFGWAAESVLMRYPFDSADSSSWVMSRRFFVFQMRSKGRPSSKFMRFKTADETRVNTRNHGIMMAMDQAWNLEQKLKSKWDRYLLAARRKAVS